MMNIDNYGLRLYGANLDELIKMALREDIGDGDHSTLACIPPTAQGTAKMVAKQDGILCGAEVGERVFKIVDNNLIVNLLKHDGDAIFKGEIVMTIEGPSGSVRITRPLSTSLENS